jgi:imidazolonepropionase-like amidohydrolase
MVSTECLKKTRDEFRRGSDFIKVMGSGGMLKAGNDIMRTAFTGEEIGAFTSVADAAGSYVTAHAYSAHSIKFSIANGVRGIERGNFLDRYTANLMKEKGVFLTLTLAAFATYAESPLSSEAEKGRAKASLEAGMQALKIAEEAGVTICFGTDLLGPMQAFRSKEFGLRAKVRRRCSKLCLQPRILAETPTKIESVQLTATSNTKLSKP